MLTGHPDRELVKYVLEGLVNGFDVGFLHGGVLIDALKNNKSALENVAQVSIAIQKGVQNNTLHGPFYSKPLSNLHISPIGAAIKEDGSVRIILDLSSPRGHAVNDFIDKEDFPVKYTQFDEATDKIVDMGPYTFLAKLDIKNAFTICPVRKDQWVLLGFKWDNRFYLFPILPFGLRSSPYIFNSLADLICWIINNYGCNALHYLDDFIMAHLGRERCGLFLQKAIDLFKDLGVPLAENKIEGPVQVIKYLGIIIDVTRMEIRLPEDKLLKILNLIKLWLGKKVCKKRGLLSLIGLLSFACKVVKPGRIFLRRLISLGTTMHSLEDTCVLSSDAILDIEWWGKFLEVWNGKSLIVSNTKIDIQIFTDASNLGMGGVCNRMWFSTAWPKKYKDKHINILELFGVAAAICTWLEDKNNINVLIYTDNKNIVDIWYSGSTQCKDMMDIIRYLFFFTAKRNINVQLQHIYGYNNTAADLLSRLQVPRFKQRFPDADEEMSVIHTDIWAICKN